MHMGSNDDDVVITCAWLPTKRSGHARVEQLHLRLLYAYKNISSAVLAKL